MNLWSVFVTGLLAGGASCAAVQGGLLAGAVARRRHPDPAPGGAVSTDTLRSRADDLGPVGAFLGGKLVSHTLAGALLGAVGEAIAPGFRLRAVIQVGAGVARRRGRTSPAAGPTTPWPWTRTRPGRLGPPPSTPPASSTS